MRWPVFLLMFPLMGQPTRIGPNSVAAMMPPTTANPIIVATMERTIGLMRFRAGIVCLILVAFEGGISPKIVKQLNPRSFAF